MRRIAVILGGRSSENAISLASAASVVGALEASGNEVVSVQIDREGRWERVGERHRRSGVGDDVREGYAHRDRNRSRRSCSAERRRTVE